MDAVFIQARLKSTRLEKKVIKEYKGLSVIEYQINRIKANSKTPIILLTSTNPQDDPLEKLCEKMKIPIFRGSEEDVIDRFCQCAISYKIKNFYLIYGDEPFTDINSLNNNFNILNKESNVIIFNNYLAEGTYGYGFTQTAANELNKIKANSNNEVWGDMAKKSGLKIIEKKEDSSLIDVRLTIDYPEDFIVFTKIIDYFNENIFVTTVEEIIEFYRNNKLNLINGKRTIDYNNRINEQSKF